MALYLVATPIGNLKDISLRALEVLKFVDFIYAEDSRVSTKLMNFYNIKTKINSYHEHSSPKKEKEILELLQAGKNLAYVSDAGMPCISDPGKRLVNIALKNGIEYTVIPGPNAAISAFAASCFEDAGFLFLGFLDRKNFKAELKKIENLDYPVVLYEAPHRVKDLLEEIFKTLGNRKIFVCRELTKLHESFIFGKVDELIEHDEIKNPRGEFVIIIEKNTDEAEMLEEDEVFKIARKRLEDGEKISAIAKDLAKMSGLQRSTIYKKLSE